MAFGSKANSVALKTATAPLRAALYLRVSTGRQAKHDVSLPSQRKLNTDFCERGGWTVVDEYVEPGLTATDDRRPAFQAMIDRACDPDQPYDVIVVHAFSRFYRDGAAMELVIRKLRKHGVEVASVTQPSSDDPSGAMIRQIIGIFDEYTSKENGRQVTRAMTENARQGFWNGAAPPLGYTIVEAERRGQKIKKKLAVDPVEAETVRLIFRLYLEGDPATAKPPMGIKETVKWLNSHGYRTKKGGTFGVGPVHHILTNKAYVGRWHYHSRNSKSGGKHPAGEVVEVPVPVIIEDSVFAAVEAKLAANNPRVSPVRAVSGPILLTSIATCSHCGGGMTQRTGTSATGRVYAYYTCATRAQKGPTACKGNTIPMAYLDNMVLKALNEKLFAPERLAGLLTAMAVKRSERAEAHSARLVALQVEADAAKERLQRLYTLVEDGLAEMDDLLRERITILKADREKAQVALDRARREVGGEAALDSEKIAAFSRLMRGVLENADNPTRKAYLRSLLTVEVGPEKVRIMGNRETLFAAANATDSSGELVQFSGLKWRTRRDSNARPLPSENG